VAGKKKERSYYFLVEDYDDRAASAKRGKARQVVEVF